ncbi:MAG: hypothetical protein HOC91_03860 [Nitrospinaceae bacterium]|nr:hypothetical protein [Nitrospinaceae bacterium]MBT3433835.1 hypothetical protein [Nitrospinaceae bacterium]MBT3821976.1 hypothetical protein [Nitrospinaceae bacterium]MBT4093271.1 hypothetical protein [Nitrospinaceae bacterium]MBT4429629.1 hypothetical protein [Nitrospinaceae bacterium]
MEEKSSESYHEKFYQIVQNRILQQSKDISDIDSKLSILIGFNGIFMSLALGLQKVPKEWCAFGTWFYWLGCGSIIIAIGLLIRAYMPQEWQFPPNPEAVLKEADDEKNIEETYQQLIANIVDAYKDNRAPFVRKGQLLKISLFFTFFGLLALGLSRLLV